MTDWINVEDEMPEIGQRVEYKATVMEGHPSESVIQDIGSFDGYYVDEDGKEWRSMHIFVQEHGIGFLTGDVQFWRPVHD